MTTNADGTTQTNLLKLVRYAAKNADVATSKRTQRFERHTVRAHP
jgi:hypothetical protein